MEKVEKRMYGFGTKGTILNEFPNYEITSDGKIWNIKKQSYMKPFENVVKHRPNNQYYLRIGLTTKHGRKKIMVHRLVAMAYIPNPKKKSFINHKDGDKHNNKMENLEWVSNKENCIHASRNGLLPKKLTNQQVKEIRSNEFGDWSNQDIANHFGVSRRLIGMIKQGVRRQYV